jgi:hypothetical protein
MLRSLCLSLILVFSCTLTSLMACMCMNDFQRIKSLEDLKSYEFVALVKVTSETTNPPSGSTPFRDAMLGFKIIEKFKGEDIREIIEKDVQSSCDMGIDVGDEWVLFGALHNGNLFVGAVAEMSGTGARTASATGTSSAVWRKWKI